jgi:predicted  nucleic acid-binding Zn-ribbon protein
MSFPSHWRNLAVIILCVGISGCEDEEQVKRLQEEVRLIGDMQRDAQSEASRLSSQIQVLTAEKEKLRQENTKLMEAMETLRKEATQLQKDFNAYRQNYKTTMRTRGVGMGLGTLVVGGTTFNEVVCRQITDEHLAVMHSTGPAKFTWEKVPDLVRAKFGIEKPGEYPQRKFQAMTPISIDAAYDTEVDNFDKAMIDSMLKYKMLSDERSKLTREIINIRQAHNMRKRKGGDTSELSMEINIAEVKVAKISAEMDALKLHQNGLLTKDPRRKKKR